MARREIFGLETLGLLDYGTIREAFNLELQRCEADCKDRSSDNRKRVVQLTVEIAPEVDLKAGDIHGDEMNVQCKISSTVPKRESKVYKMRATQDGKLVFHPDLAEEPDESTLYDEDSEKQDRKKA